MKKLGRVNPLRRKQRSDYGRSRSSLANEPENSSATLVEEPMSTLTATGEFSFWAHDTIIAVMGPTGSGKSSFINLAAGNDHVEIGHKLESCTQAVQPIRLPRPSGGGDIVLVDTPGFDDTLRSDTEILQAIADWLYATYRRKITLSGLLFLHRISDNRMAGTPLRNLSLFQKLCGNPALQDVLLVTTMWGDIDEAVGSLREKELRDLYWRSMICCGSQVVRFRYTQQSAWDIIGRCKGRGHNLLIQEEMGRGLPLSQTSAGKTLFLWLMTVIDEFRTIIHRLESALRKATGLPPGAAAEQELADARDLLSRAAVQQQHLTGADHPLRRSVTLTVVTAEDLGGESLPQVNTLPQRIPHSGSAEDPTDREDKILLQGIIIVLRGAWHADDLTMVPFLRGAVGLALKLAELVEAMHTTERDLILLAQNACLLILAVRDQIKSTDFSQEMTDAVNGFVKEMETLQKLVTEISTHSSTSRYPLGSADEQIVRSCNNKIDVTCDILGLQFAVIRQQSIARIEGEIDALAQRVLSPSLYPIRNMLPAGRGMTL
ncbi:hypothetical protein JAAARDRAFT_39718 [Jaapia argillacea MUCL 33604]|uniref:G domain-containing protein n=1 Tax=Jaapia argillacea MUCL 33604 TaxID=933084 RepID=A0A067PRQ3_9AGAM|nr:hypothetical protein JAAARDRAFT_39718 [Jaapia argillacea MUCL 33604]